jgi:phosphohistidine phosphatase SixA
VRYLTIVRHAKTSPAGHGESDFVRTLNKRGRDECEKLRLSAKDPEELGQFGPTTALVSSAARTRETFRRAFHGTPFVERCEFSELIYNGVRDVSAQDVVRELAAIDPLTTSLLVVAHNPTVLELMFTLAKELPDELRNNHYPLGGAFVLELPEDRSVALEHYDFVASFVPD